MITSMKGILKIRWCLSVIFNTCVILYVQSVHELGKQTFKPLLKGIDAPKFIKFSKKNFLPKSCTDICQQNMGEVLAARGS